MNKLRKPPSEGEADLGPELSEVEMDAWVTRNGAALKVSLQVARDQIAGGDTDTRAFAEIIAEGTRRHLAKD